MYIDTHTCTNSVTKGYRIVSVHKRQVWIWRDLGHECKRNILHEILKELMKRKSRKMKNYELKILELQNPESTIPQKTI